MIPVLTIFFKIFVHLVSELTYQGTRNDYIYLLDHTMYHEQDYLPEDFSYIRAKPWMFRLSLNYLSEDFSYIRAKPWMFRLSLRS